MNFEGIFFEICDFELTDIFLGSGSFGKVYVAKCKKDNKQYAAKIINIDSHQNFSGTDQRNIMRESTILHDLSHPSIVKFFGVNFQSFTQFNKLEPTIITEYLPKGSLKEILDKEKHGLADHEWTPTKKFICLLAICSAMEYLHENGIIHRDLKPENILIDDNYFPKVSDFGLSRCFPLFLSNSIKFTMTGQIGTPMYMPPEILMEEKSHYGPEVDIYAFGILAYEIVTGKVPYHELGSKITAIGLANKVFSGYRPIFPDNVPEKMKELISKCWSQDPNERPSFHSIFSILSKDMSLLGESIDEEEVREYLNMLDDYQKDEKAKEKNELKKLSESLRLLINSIENKHNKEIDTNDLTREKIADFCRLVESWRSISDIAVKRLHISDYDYEKVDKKFSLILTSTEQLKQLREQIQEQSKWTSYINHILSQMKNSLIEVEEKLLIVYDPEESDHNPYEFLYDRFKDFIDYCYIMNRKINERGGFDAIDESIKEKNDLKFMMQSNEYLRMKKANETIKNYIGENFTLNDLEDVLKSQDSRYISLAHSIRDKFGQDVNADDLQHKMPIEDEVSISFANKIRNIFDESENDDEILENIIKFKEMLHGDGQEK